MIKNGRSIPLPGIPLSVIDTQGEVVATAVTEFDGFYVIAGLSPGNYSISVDPAALRRFKVESMPAQEFMADPDEGVIYLDTLVIE